MESLLKFCRLHRCGRRRSSSNIEYDKEVQQDADSCSGAEKNHKQSWRQLSCGIRELHQLTEQPKPVVGVLFRQENADSNCKAD